MSLTLQGRLERIQNRLRYLKAEFPAWRLWGGYGPGNTPPAYYDEILRLEKERERIILKLSTSVERLSRGESKFANETAASQFTHSPDYRSVTILGKTFALTLQQARMIEILYEAHKDGNRDISTAYVLEKLDMKSSRWQDTWRSNPKAKKALIESGASKGTLRLNL